MSSLTISVRSALRSFRPLYLKSPSPLYSFRMLSTEQENKEPSHPPSDEDTIVTALKEENSKLMEKVKDIDDRYKRALAEGENTRVRMRKQIEDAKIYGIQGFCKDLLEVADVLEKAVESVPKDEMANNSILRDLFTGLDMTEKQMQSVFRRHGLLKMNPIGEKFNPNDHHAMFEVPIAGKEPGTVAQVTQVGYKLQDRTIRPAMVGVVKAP